MIIKRNNADDHVVLHTAELAIEYVLARMNRVYSSNITDKTRNLISMLDTIQEAIDED